MESLGILVANTAIGRQNATKTNNDVGNVQNILTPPRNVKATANRSVATARANMKSGTISAQYGLLNPEDCIH